MFGRTRNINRIQDFNKKNISKSKAFEPKKEYLVIGDGTDLLQVTSGQLRIKLWDKQR